MGLESFTKNVASRLEPLYRQAPDDDLGMLLRRQSIYGLSAVASVIMLPETLTKLSNSTSGETFALNLGTSIVLAATAGLGATGFWLKTESRLAENPNLPRPNLDRIDKLGNRILPRERAKNYPKEAPRVPFLDRALSRIGETKDCLIEKYVGNNRGLTTIGQFKDSMWQKYVGSERAIIERQISLGIPEKRLARGILGVSATIAGETILYAAGQSLQVDLSNPIYLASVTVLGAFGVREATKAIVSGNQRQELHTIEEIKKIEEKRDELKKIRKEIMEIQEIATKGSEVVADLDSLPDETRTRLDELIAVQYNIQQQVLILSKEEIKRSQKNVQDDDSNEDM